MTETPVLTLIQNELKAPKSQYNKFGKYSYRNCEDILEALKPLLLKHKSDLVISDEIIMVGDRFYVKATCTFYAANRAEEEKCCGWARESQDKKGMDAAQITGAASSYARKYALNGLFLIDDTKDADSQAPVKEAKKAEQPKQFKPMIDKVFENPDEKTIESLRASLSKEKAPIKALAYFDTLANEFYQKQKELMAETL